MRVIHCTSDESGTRALGARLGEALKPDGVLLLSGDLGAGKTVLTQGLATALGIDALQVHSPSFTLIREHQGMAGRLIHIDLYRLEEEDVESLGLWEILAGPGIKVVEWAERLPFEVPQAVQLEIRVLESPGRRRFEIVGLADPGQTEQRPETEAKAEQSN